MKKLLVVLLSLGLIVAFGATASAQPTVKFSGSYYVQGTYDNNPLLTPDDFGQVHYSHAFFYQRFRFQPVFTIAEGLTFTARMDAMEKQWGQSDWRGPITTGLGAGPDDQTATRGRSSAVAAPKRGIQESLEFERAYVTFMTGIGMFQVGYQNVDDWGTDYGDYSNSRARILYVTKFGPMTFGAYYEKIYENDTTQGLPAAMVNATDADRDSYALTATYNGKGLEAGLLYKYYALNNNRPLGVKTYFSLVSPYVKATIGNFFIESELQYWFGKVAEYEGVGVLPSDVDLKAWGAFVRGRFNMGPAYFGGAFSYASGNDMSDPTENTTNPGGAGTNWSPALLLLNDGYASQSGGTVSSGSTTNVTTSKYNSIIYNAFAGFNPTPKLNLEMALTYATVAQKALSRSAAGIVYEAGDNVLGTELDLKATYKIYDNLTYMVGAGYLWAGDYFKYVGTVPGGAQNKVDNTYILTNQLTLSF